MKQTLLKIAILSMIVSLTACSAKRALENSEKALNTDGGTTMLFHSVLYYPKEISLNFSGFIVGVEKSKVDIISSPEDRVFKPQSTFGKKWLFFDSSAEDTIFDSKVLFISHIIENNSEQFGQKNCALYNAYVQPDSQDLQIVKPCSSNNFSKYNPKQAYANSWFALDNLQSALKTKIDNQKEEEPYTHIVVMTMGWNTVQEEAVRNFNSIMDNLYQNMKDENEKLNPEISPLKFNPLFVGVTWPSQWEWSVPVLSSIDKPFSFVTKREDADELGLTWLGIILNKVIPEVNTKNLPVVAIGHSFGARATSTAACYGPLIQRSKSAADNIALYNQKNYKLISLQGAFSINRLLDDEGDGGEVKFPDHCSNVGSILLTASTHDDALPRAFWGSYAGSNNKLLWIWNKGYKQYCELPSSISTLSCVKANADGSLTQKNVSNHILYVNADELIKQNAYLSGGGAHSDIYRMEQAKLIWDFIKK